MDELREVLLIPFQWRIQDFPEEGALTPEEGGYQPIIWSIFPENCMKMKKFWARGGDACPSRPPSLDPPLHLWKYKKCLYSMLFTIQGSTTTLYNPLTGEVQQFVSIS